MYNACISSQFRFYLCMKIGNKHKFVVDPVTQVVSKHCSLCKQLLPTTSFYPQKSSGTWYTSRCKSCTYTKKIQYPVYLTDSNNISYKICWACGHILPFSHFHKSKSGKYGICSICKQCKKHKDIFNHYPSSQWTFDSSLAVLDTLFFSMET